VYIFRHSLPFSALRNGQETAAVFSHDAWKKSGPTSVLLLNAPVQLNRTNEINRIFNNYMQDLFYKHNKLIIFIIS
jgi:hypothetical protein